MRAQQPPALDTAERAALCPYASQAMPPEEPAPMVYDRDNAFAKILRGEIPCKRVYEDEHALAFHDINPLAPVHVLVIPKGEYMSMDDFTSKAPTETIAGFFRAVGEVARELGLAGSGYRFLANTGAHGHQEVPHFHVHIFGGAPLGRMLNKVAAR
jgi:diadenosine tetraphosphate (Ap4A) HIT family hydrolase